MSVLYIQFLYRGDRLWLRVSSVNNQTVVGRVWSVRFKPGLLFGQMIQIPICDMLDDWALNVVEESDPGVNPVDVRV